MTRQRDANDGWRAVSALVVVALVTASLAGCGGGDDQLNQDDVQAAATAAVKKEREQQRLRTLEKELRQLKNQNQNQNQKGAVGAPNGDASNSSGSSSSSGIVSDCGNGVSVGPNTTCEFAQYVAEGYRSTGGPVVRAYSPARDDTFAMTCADGDPAVCRGGDNASVFIDD